MNEIYFLSGLGADERLFQNLDLPGIKINHIRWVEPGANESIEDYAFRLTEQIHSEKPVLAGMSFGGMMAIEIAKHIETTKIILISSVKTRKEIPFYFKLAALFRLNYVFPVSLLKQPSPIIYWLFGTTNASDRLILRNILKDTDTTFLKWAIKKIWGWKNIFIPDNLIHIHGTSDRLLPFARVKADHVIKGGGHLMVLNRADILSMELMEILEISG